jgi:hypothetical protein
MLNLDNKDALLMIGTTWPLPKNCFQTKEPTKAKVIKRKSPHMLVVNVLLGANVKCGARLKG